MRIGGQLGRIRRCGLAEVVSAEALRITIFLGPTFERTKLFLRQRLDGDYFVRRIDLSQ